MQSKATTVEQYLAELPADRRAALETVRRVILDNLDPDYEEGVQYGMIGYYVPHRVYPAGYHCDPRQPLPFAALGAQKNYMSLYLMSLYGDSGGSAHARHGQWFRQAWARTGKKLDMGKSCIRFKKPEDLAIEVIGEAIRRVPARQYVAWIRSAMDRSGQTKTAKKPAARSPAVAPRATARPRTAARVKMPKRAAQRTKNR